jgi:hypothetical protein
LWARVVAGATRYLFAVVLLGLLAAEAAVVAWRIYPTTLLLPVLDIQFLYQTIVAIIQLRTGEVHAPLAQGQAKRLSIAVGAVQGAVTQAALTTALVGQAALAPKETITPEITTWAAVAVVALLGMLAVVASEGVIPAAVVVALAALALAAGVVGFTQRFFAFRAAMAAEVEAA